MSNLTVTVQAHRATVTLTCGATGNTAATAGVPISCTIAATASGSTTTFGGITLPISYCARRMCQSVVMRRTDRK